MNKKIVTIFLILIFIFAFGALNVLKSQFDASTIPIQVESVDDLPPPPIFTAGQPNPEYEGGTNFMVEEIEPTNVPNPHGCQLSQGAIDQLLTQINNIFNNSLDMAQIMLNVANTAPEPLLSSLNDLLLNQHMPQDDSRTCKAINEKITYLEQLTTLLDDFILYTLPSDAGAIVLNKKGYRYEIS